MKSKPKPSAGLNHDTNETRKVSMVMKSSDFDRIKKIDPFTQMKSNPCGTGKKR